MLDIHVLPMLVHAKKFPTLHQATRVKLLLHSTIRCDMKIMSVLLCRASIRVVIEGMFRKFYLKISKIANNLKNVCILYWCMHLSSNNMVHAINYETIDHSIPILFPISVHASELPVTGYSIPRLNRLALASTLVMYVSYDKARGTRAFSRENGYFFVKNKTSIQWTPGS